MSRERFRERPDSELQTLSDEETVAYISAAYAAGRGDLGKRALAIFAFGEWDRIRARVAMKVPPHEVENVAGEVLASALGAAFTGESVGELRSLLNTVTARRIADFHKRRRVDVDPLDPDLDSEGGKWRPGPAVDSETGAVESSIVVEQLLGGLRPDHRQVVELFVLDGWPAAEVAAQLEGMSAQNVHQIGSRFRSDLRKALDDGDTSG